MDSLREKIDTLDTKFESVLHGFLGSQKHQDGSESQTSPPAPPEAPDEPKKPASVKRSFLARFLEDEDELPAQKARDDVEKGLYNRFLEQVFGICDADPKQGRDASSLIHPQSAFATGGSGRLSCSHRRR
jgi:hypothetical protein